MEAVTGHARGRASCSSSKYLQQCVANLGDSSLRSLCHIYEWIIIIIFIIIIIITKSPVVRRCCASCSSVAKSLRDQGICGRLSKLCINISSSRPGMCYQRQNIPGPCCHFSPPFPHHTLHGYELFQPQWRLTAVFSSSYPHYPDPLFSLSVL